MSVFGGNAVETIALEDGSAEPMGCGVFVVTQRDTTAQGDGWQSVTLSKADLEAMLAAA